MIVLKIPLADKIACTSSRLETIKGTYKADWRGPFINETYEATTVFYGKAGFNGYVGFVFKEFTILESLIYGNAIYVFDKNWLEFSKLTKKEILDRNLHIKRIIHKEGWEKEVEELFKQE